MSDLPSPVENRVSLTDTIQRAIRRERSGDTSGARDRYRSVLEKSPRNFEALILLGNLERRSGNHQAAAAYYRAALRIEPGRAEIYDALGQTLGDLGESRASMRAFLRAIEIDAGYAPTYVSMGRAFVRIGRAAESRKCFAEACRINPALSEAHICLADSYLAGGKAEQAKSAYLRGIKLDPDSVEPRLRLAGILTEEGDYEAAIKQYEYALARRPDCAESHVGHAAALIGEHRFDEALESCQKALQCEPRSVEAMVHIGTIHLSRGDLRGARQSFLNAISVDPELTSARTGMAAMLAAEGRLGEALPLVRSVIHNEDAGFESDLVLARILRATGESGEALQRLRIRLASLPSTAGRARRAVELESARILEDEGRYDQALLHYATAAGLARRSFDPAACRREVDRILEFFDASSLARLSRARLLAATPVIIVGLPSAGVRNLYNAITAHTRVSVPTAAAALDNAATGLASHVASGRSYPDSAADARGADLDAYVRELWPQAVRAAQRDCFVADASWRCDLHLGLAEILFPNARVIHCVRDPRDLVLGCYFRDYVGPECAFGGNLADVVVRLRCHERLMKHWRRTGDLRFLTVAREALANDPIAELERILAFLDLDFEPQCLALAGPRSGSGSPGFHTPIHDPSIGRHRNYASVLGPGLAAALAASDERESLPRE